MIRRPWVIEPMNPAARAASARPVPRAALGGAGLGFGRAAGRRPKPRPAPPSAARGAGRAEAARRGAGVGGPCHEERRATRPAGVALQRSATSREGAITQGSIAVDAVINWMGKTLFGSVLV